MEKKFLKRGKGFTLIELIAVLVIMAIIALIVTPLVMNTIRKARVSADKRSVDAYGRSIELAIAGYLLDTGKFPTEISQLTIEYSGNKVECETTRINSDSSVYLAGCTVAGRNVENYTYGEDKTPQAPTYTAYTIGNQVTYNNINYYVIKDSGAKESTVTLLKAEPLSVAEVNQYGTGHVNRYTKTSVGTAYNQNGYGAMAYYTSETCGYVNNNWVETGCKSDYASSEVKYVVDAWKASKAPAASEVRIITTEDLVSLGYVKNSETRYSKGDNVPTWVYNSNYYYWTMSPWNDSASRVWYVYSDGGLYDYHYVYIDYVVVRPVITISKSSI